MCKPEARRSPRQDAPLMKAPSYKATVVKTSGNTGSELTSCNKSCPSAGHRRHFLKAALRTTAASVPLLSSAPLLSDVFNPALESARELAVNSPAAQDYESDRILRLWNVNTGEHYEGPYWSHGRFIPAALDQISFLLRDHRLDEARPIDPLVIDFMYAVQAKLPDNDSSEPIQVLSGYRSPQTNASLAKRSNGVAKNSLHMTGKAIDFRMSGHAAKTLRQLAINLRRGGVGFYPEKDFIHIDTGPVRTWK